MVSLFFDTLLEEHINFFIAAGWICLLMVVWKGRLIPRSFNYVLVLLPKLLTKQNVPLILIFIGWFILFFWCFPSLPKILGWKILFAYCEFEMFVIWVVDDWPHLLYPFIFDNTRYEIFLDKNYSGLHAAVLQDIAAFFFEYLGITNFSADSLFFYTWLF